MRLTIKTLNQETFKVEVNDTDKVKNLKEKIQHDKGAQAFPVENQRLIYSGAILEDSQPISHYKIDESKFIVLMLSKSSTDVSRRQQTILTPNNRDAAASGSRPTSPMSRSAAPPNADTRQATTRNTADTAAGSVKNAEEELVSAMQDSLNFPDFPGNYPSMEELLQNAFRDANPTLPFNIAELNLNDNPFSHDGRDQLENLKVEIDRAGGLDAFISSAIANANQSPSLLASAMAVRDTSHHMGMSVEDTISMLMEGPPNPFSLEQPEHPETPNSASSVLTPSLPENVAGNRAVSNQLVTEIMAMGFDRESVTTALELCMNNVESAIEYLTTGIPPDLISDMENLIGSSENHSQPRFPSTGSDEASPFEYIRNHPDLRDTLTMVRENPEMLSVLLQRVAEESPELLQYISDHQEELIQFVNNLPSEMTSGSDGNLTYDEPSSITDEERADVAQLMALGFTEMESIQAYFAFDKNVQMAAEFLLSDSNE